MRRILLVLASATAALIVSAGPAAADPPNGNSGHVGSNASQCQNGQDHCPPFGP